MSFLSFCMLVYNYTKQELKEGIFMLQKFILKYGHLVTTFAFFVTSYGVNRMCFTFLHDPKMLENVKELRKF